MRARRIVLALAAVVSCDAPRPAIGPPPPARGFAEASEAPALLLVRDGAAPVELWPFDLPALSSDGAEIASLESVAPPLSVVHAGGGPGAALVTRRADTGEVVRRRTLLSPEETLLDDGALDPLRRRVETANAELGGRSWTPMVQAGDAGAACDAPARPLRIGRLEVAVVAGGLVVREGQRVVTEVATRMATPRLVRVHADRAQRTLLVAVAACDGAAEATTLLAVRLP